MSARVGESARRVTLTVVADGGLVGCLFFPCLVGVVLGVEEPAESHLPRVKLATGFGKGAAQRNSPGSGVRDTLSA
jgi:hypothetical protein